MEKLMFVAGLSLTVAGLISGAAETGAFGTRTDQRAAEAAQITRRAVVASTTSDTSRRGAEVRDIGIAVGPDGLQGPAPDTEKQMLVKYAEPLTLVLGEGVAIAPALIDHTSVPGAKRERFQLLAKEGRVNLTYTQAVAIFVVPIKAEGN